MMRNGVRSWTRRGVAVVLLGLCSTWTGAWVRADDGETTIAAIKVEGARRYAEQSVLNTIKLRVGQPYRPSAVREAVRQLDATQRYVNVNAEEIPVDEGMQVTFRVIERATVQEVVYRGVKHINKEELETITGLRKGSPMSVALNMRAAQAIEKKYVELGRLMATVDVVEGNKDEDTRVVFQVMEGPVVRIRDIDFEGNTFVSAARLKTQIDSKASILGFSGKYLPPLLDQDVQKLLEYYRTFGYFDVKIRYEKRWNPGYETINVVFVIDEGPRFLVKDVGVAGNKKLDDDVLIAKNNLERGKPYDGRVMQASVRRIQDEYGRRGYAAARVQPEFSFSEEPGSVRVTYQVFEGPPARVGEINIIGNTVTRDNVIRRQLLVYPGQILSTPELRASERLLTRLNIFKNDPQTGVAPTITVLDPESDSPFKDLLVQVEEDRTGSLLVGMGINSDAGATAQIVLTERNFDITRIPTSFDDVLANRAFRGAGQEFRMEVVPGTELSRYTVSWREPYLFDSMNSLGVSGYYYTRRFMDYDEQRTGGRVTVGRRVTPLWTASLGFRAENVFISNYAFFAPSDIQEAGGNNALYAPKVSLGRDSRDSILRPTQGNLFEVSFEYGLGDFNFPIVSIEESQYFTLYERPDGSGRHVLALRGQVGFAGDNTPIFERFFAGGFRTIRGFEFRGVGPNKNGFMVGGEFMLLASAEYQIPLLASDNVYAVAFVDGGTVESDVEINDFRVSAGAGLRLIVPMFGPVPIALDWAYPIVKKSTDLRELFSFYVGFTR